MEVILWILSGYIIAIMSFIISMLIEEKESKIVEEKFRKEDIDRLKKSFDKIKKENK